MCFVVHLFFLKIVLVKYIDAILLNLDPDIVHSGPRIHSTCSKQFFSFIIFLNIKCGHRNVLSKRQVWMSIFHIINTGVLDFFNKKLILDYYFCLKSGPVFLFQIFIIAPSPSQGISNCIINNKSINNKFRFSI